MTGQTVTTKQMMKEFALKLRNANPTAWENFVNTLDVYTAEVMQGMTSSPQSEILCMQGRAQQCLALLQIYRECTPSSSSPAVPQQ